MRHRITAAARQSLTTDSTWVRQALKAALKCHGATDWQFAVPLGLQADKRAADDEPVSGARLSIRLRPDDRLLLRDRSAARGMPAATYASVVVRVHLRQLAPIPKTELLALKRSVAELGAIGRNLNQIARVANESGRIAGRTREDLRPFIKVCEGLRDHVKALIKANVESWEIGHADDAR